MIDDSGIQAIRAKMMDLLRAHAVDRRSAGQPLDGAFSLYRGGSEADLYGMLDAVYILHTLGRLDEYTSRASREVWAARILECQDGEGWFSLRNLRGHPREHATAYATGALRLLEVEEGESYADRIRPFLGMKALLMQHAAFDRWITRMGFYRLSDIPRKNVGWHHVWRGSHIAGGVAATVGMMRDHIHDWWPAEVDIDQWFEWYFGWLDREVNRETGYWQRAFWNLIIRRPTIIDLGGAAHFFWIYDAAGRAFRYPERVIESTIGLQRRTGLYREYPFCIDLDANFAIVRPFLQLDAAAQAALRDEVVGALESNFDAVARVLISQDLSEVYSNLHGPPGALAALTECTKLPGFSRSGLLSGWQHVLDRTWWL